MKQNGTQNEESNEFCRNIVANVKGGGIRVGPEYNNEKSRSEFQQCVSMQNSFLQVNVS